MDVKIRNKTQNSDITLGYVPVSLIGKLIFDDVQNFPSEDKYLLVSTGPHQGKFFIKEGDILELQFKHNS